MKLHVLYISILVGCSGSNSETKIVETKAKNTADQIAFSLALDQCKEEGRDAGKYSVYEECAKKADEKYGRKGDSK